MPIETPDRQKVPGPAVDSGPVPAPPPELWRPRDLVLLILFIPVALLASNLLAFAGYAALGPWLRLHGTPQSVSHDPLFLLCLQSLFYVLLFAYIYLLVAIQYRAPFWKTLKFRPLRLPQALRFLFGGVALSFFVMLAPSLLPESKSFPLEKMFNSPAAAYAIAAFATLIAPFMEELLFRGVLFAFLEKHGGLNFAVLATAILFAGLHVPEYWGAWDHVLLIFVVGVVFSVARGLTGSLTPSVVLHFAYNATLMAALYLQTNQFRTVPGFVRL